MKKHTLFGIGVATAAIALAATLVTAQAGSDEGRRSRFDQQVGQQAGGGRGGRGGLQGPGGRLGGALAGLNLSEEQRAKVAEIERAGRTQAAPVEIELRATQNALQRELFADARDGAKVADLSAKVTALQSRLADVHVKTAGSLADVLTAEQRATVRDREGRGGGPGRGGPGRGFGRFRQSEKAR